MVVCGDTKHDLVIAASQKPLNASLHYSSDEVVFVAGSIWAEGAKVLFPVFEKILSKFPKFKLILAPHDLRFVDEFCRYFPQAARYSSVKKGASPQVVVVDSIGQLAGLYRFAQVAYVGGGFANFGLHNVIEAAVFAPLLWVGPQFHSSHEAEQMVSQKAITVISSTQQAEKELLEFLQNRQKFDKQRKACGDYVRKNQGATEKIVRALLVEMESSEAKRFS